MPMRPAFKDRGRGWQGPEILAEILAMILAMILAEIMNERH